MKVTRQGVLRYLKAVFSIRRGHRRVCIVDALYPLFLYLLYSTEEEVADTLFFFGRTIPESLAQQVGSFVYGTAFEPDDEGRRLDHRILISRLKFMLINLLCVRGRKVFAQDHLSFAEMLLCRRRYIHLEDAPGSYLAILERLKAAPAKPWTFRNYWLVGSLRGRFFGTNPQCVNRLITRREELDHPLTAGRRHEYVDLVARWQALAPARREWFLKLFGVTPEVLDLIRSFDVVFFTQPIQADCGLTDEEMKDVMEEVFRACGTCQILIKVHPRDAFDYARAFASVKVLRTSAPMQLLNFVCRPFRKAATICSTSVFMLPQTTEVLWLGTKIHQKIASRYGNY